MIQTRNFNKIGITFFSLMLLLGITPAFNWLPNFYNYVNYTSVNSFAIFNGLNIGQTNYVYLNLSNITWNGNAILPYIQQSNYQLQGYNGSVFKGNVTGYPYLDGLLVPIKTYAGLTYNTLTLFFNQPFKTNTTSSSNFTKIKWSGTSSFFQVSNNRYSVKYESSLYSFIDYLTDINFTNCNFASFNGLLNMTTICAWHFTTKQGYYFFESSIYPYQNVSMDYITQSGWNEYNLYGTNTLYSLVNHGLIGSQKVTEPLTKPYFAVINSTKSLNYYDILSYGLGENFVYLFNSSTQLTPYSSWTGTNSKATINLNIPYAYNHTTFILAPAYTTQYSNTIVYYNSTPYVSNAIIPCNFSNTYRIPISNINWTYNFTTYAYPRSPFNYTDYNATSHTFIIPANYLEFTIPHYNEMGNSCEHIIIRTNTSYTDYIPFYIISCNSSGQTATFLIPHRSELGYAFSNFYVYYNSSLNTVSNTDVYNSFVIHNSNSFDLDYLGIITLSSPFNVNSMIAIREGIYGSPYSFFTQNALYGVQEIKQEYTSLAHLLAPDPYTKLLIYSFGIGYNLIIASQKLAYYETYGIQARIVNTTQTADAFPTFWSPSLNMEYPLTAKETHFYSMQGSVGIPQLVLNTCPPPPSPLPSTPNVYYNNTNNMINVTSPFGNQTDFISHFLTPVNFMGIILPQYYLLGIAIVMIILLGISLAMKNEFAFIILLIGFWASGILAILLIPSGYMLMVIALIITLYYVVRNAPKWFR